MAELKLNILRPSVNNLCVRVFVRAADLDFEETDVWGHTTGPEYLGKYPPHLTPTIETAGLARPTLGSDISAANDMFDITGVGQIRLKPVGIHVERRSFCPSATFDGNFLRPIGTGQQFGSTLFTVDSAIA